MAIDNFIESVCVETAVLWSYDGPNEFGQASFSAPVEINCRWQDDQKTTKDNDGTEFTSSAEILLTQDVKKGDYLYHGTLDSINNESDPKNVEDAYEIKRFTKIPMIRSTTIFVRKAFL